MRVSPFQAAAIGVTVAACMSMTGAFAQQKYDLLLKGGHVIDPKNNITAVRDVAISAGKIAAVAARSRIVRAAEVTGIPWRRVMSWGWRVACV